MEQVVPFKVQRRLPYIDGLRAIAVLAILAYHFKLGIAPQGFLGVDIFFVISGYVVCRSLTATISDGHPSLLVYLEHFYRRRFWRLIPALAGMVAFTLLLVALFVPPAYLSRLIFYTAAGAASGVANIVLALADEANYFDQMADYNPFLHTWSLGVEEQFYVIFPFLLWILPRAGRTAILLALALASLALSAAWGSSKPMDAFYLLPSRFWELASGALAYQASANAGRWVRAAQARALAAWLGIIFIFLSLLSPVQVASPFPGAILPVIGMVLVLWYGPWTTTSWAFPGRWLSVPVAVYIGKISYSLYLWHWPVVVLLRWTVGYWETWQIALAILASFLLAIASYHGIEQPFQRTAIAQRALRRAAFISAAFAVLSVSLAVLVTGHSRNFVYDRLLGRLSVVRHEPGWQPHDLPEVGPQSPDALGGKRPFLIVVGDSHAGAIAGVAATTAKDANLSLVVSGGCGFTLLRPVRDNGTCASAFAALNGAQAGDIVLFAALNVPRYVDQDGTPFPEPDFDNPGRIAERQAALSQFTDIVLKLRERGVAVIIRGPEPLFRFIPFRCSDWFNRVNPICAAPTKEPRSALTARAQPVLDSIIALRQSIPSVVVWNVFDVLCPGLECSIFDAGGHPLFSDQDHLSGWGNALLLPSLNETLSTAQSAP